MKTVKIDRTKWSRGDKKSAAVSYLLASNSLWNTNTNSGCCLGHACNQVIGTTFEAMDRIPYPENLGLVVLLSDELEYETKLDLEAAKINDDVLISDAERELKLISIFDKGGVKLEFYN